jgi:hypothetical protein
MTNTRAKSPETPLRTHAGTDHLLQTADHKPVSAAASIEFLHPARLFKGTSDIALSKQIITRANRSTHHLLKA